MTDASSIIAASHAVKDARKVLEPALKPLESEIRGELSMLELAKLSTMLLTYNMDKALSTESAAKNYIALQNTILAAAQRAIGGTGKLPDLSAQLPEAAKTAEVAAVLRELKADALLKVLGTEKSTAGYSPAAPISFED